MEQSLPMYLETSPEPKNEMSMTFVRAPRMSVHTACLLSIEYLSLTVNSELNVPHRPAETEGKELVQSMRGDSTFQEDICTSQITGLQRLRGGLKLLSRGTAGSIATAKWISGQTAKPARNARQMLGSRPM